MFRKILTPVDLAHLGALDRALEVSADMAKRHGAEIVYVGVTTQAPSAVARTTEEYERKLSTFAATEGEKHGCKTSAHMVVSHDPAIDLNINLMRATEEIGADLIVMGTHIPGLAEHVWASHGGAVASHAGVSVFLVRG
ncbi:universal stress protein [Pikeienuella piscinae]|uniref:Universal stress protein n=1 Tax=Pikeienuella piscinae TaxID=2748098 RepID=A0A7L5BU61_9RHOB|nr:universal stress protein [Pikeienuella piscinae]QIE54741.1 universal stress protein [Pikeienuella piscinae]